MHDFCAGDILSYSAGSTQAGPDGFRKVNRAGLNLTAIVRSHWPDRLLPFRARPPLVINAYPALVALPSDGVLVDCYMSVRTASRALQLAAREQMPVIILSQPLFLGQLLTHYLSLNLALPDALIAVVGGYWLPPSLHAALATSLSQRDVQFACLQGYGVAEVEAGLLWAADLDAQGRARFRLRGPDVHAELRNGRLHLALKSPDGTLKAEPFDTGDAAEFAVTDRDGSGPVEVLISSSTARLASDIRAELTSWSAADWRRRTGYLARTATGLVAQLREGIVANNDGAELDYYQYAAAHRVSWLDKPRWGAA